MAEKELRALSERQARNCEQATEPVCHCRCGGALHGKKRGGPTPDREFFESLPEDDPHYVPSMEAVNARRKTKRDAERQAKNAADEAMWRARQEAARSHWDRVKELG